MRSMSRFRRLSKSFPSDDDQTGRVVLHINTDSDAGMQRRGEHEGELLIREQRLVQCDVPQITRKFSAGSMRCGGQRWV